MKNTSFNKTEGFWEKNAELIPILAILAVMGLGIVAYAVSSTIVHVARIEACSEQPSACICANLKP